MNSGGADGRHGGGIILRRHRAWIFRCTRAALGLRNGGGDALLLPLVPLLGPLLDLRLALFLEEGHLPPARQLLLLALLRRLLLLLPLLVPPGLHIDLLLLLARLPVPHAGRELAVPLDLPLSDVLLALRVDPGGGELLLGTVLCFPRLVLPVLVPGGLQGLGLLPDPQRLLRLHVADLDAIGQALLLPRGLPLGDVLGTELVELRIPPGLLRQSLGLLGLALLPRLQRGVLPRFGRSLLLGELLPQGVDVVLHEQVARAVFFHVVLRPHVLRLLPSLDALVLLPKLGSPLRRLLSKVSPLPIVFFLLVRLDLLDLPLALS
mmetsp:Transcript_84133/g.243213  ORF Transcript_84133/g.243213 Transcript_84133/m.243213 type:complete len:321 (-) Transcript_84133:987-1949(-)